MKLLLFFLAANVVMALHAARHDSLPRTRSVVILVLVTTVGFMSRRLI